MPPLRAQMLVDSDVAGPAAEANVAKHGQASNSYRMRASFGVGPNKLMREFCKEQAAAAEAAASFAAANAPPNKNERALRIGSQRKTKHGWKECCSPGQAGIGQTIKGRIVTCTFLFVVLNT